MKHEKFKSFVINDNEMEEINKFLNSNITPKSISIAKIPNILNSYYDMLFIGYIDSKKEHHYSLVKETIIYDDFESYDKKLEECAAKHKGVICQDIKISEDKDYDSLEVTFLIAN